MPSAPAWQLPPALLPRLVAAGPSGPWKALKLPEPLKPKAGNQLSCSSHFRKDTGSKLGNHAAWGHLDGAPNWRVDLDENPGTAAYPDVSMMLEMQTLQTTVTRKS